MLGLVAPSPPKIIGWTITYSGAVRNIGAGPALNVRAEFVFALSLAFNKANGQDKLLPSLGPGHEENYTFKGTVDVATYGGALPNTPPFTITITYDNVFGKQCTTVHKSVGGNNQTETTFTPPDTTPRL